MKFKYSMNEKWKIYKYLISLYMTRISYVIIIKNKILLNKNREKIYDFNILLRIYLLCSKNNLENSFSNKGDSKERQRQRERKSFNDL